MHPHNENYMSDAALYRKYRPNNFYNFIGQEHIKTTLINALKSERVSHAYLFSGPRGTGKTSCARLMAKALNCTNLNEGFEPCEKCEFCIDISDGRLIDLIEIDAASNRGIDEVRDLKEKIQFAPTYSKYKIYIIDEAHMMTKEAFNALLKTLEEPPSHAYFILATTEIHKIPDTIISRCQRFDFKRISDKCLVDRLNFIAKSEGVTIDEKATFAISKYSNGGLRDAIGIFEQLIVDNKITFESACDVLGLSDHSVVIDVYEKLMIDDTNSCLATVATLHNQGSDLKQFVHELLSCFRDNLLLDAKTSEKKNVDKILKIITVLQDASEKISASPIPQLPLEVAIIKLTGGIVESVPKLIQYEEVAMSVKSDAVARSVKNEAVTMSVESDAVQHASQIPTAPPMNSGEKFEFTMDEIKKNWPRVTERIKTPSLRMSLKNCVPTQIDKSNLTLSFNTVFHKDKVMDHNNRVELESLISEVFNHSVKILAEVKSIEILPIKKDIVNKPEVIAEKSHKNVDIDQALEIFGGQVM